MPGGFYNRVVVTGDQARRWRAVWVMLLTGIVTFFASQSLSGAEQPILGAILGLNLGALARLLVETRLDQRSLSAMPWLRAVVVWQCRWIILGALLGGPGMLLGLLQGRLAVALHWELVGLAIGALLSGWFLLRDSRNPAFPHSHPRICGNCGLRNIAERRTCKRCQHPLAAPVAQRRHP